MPKVNTRFFVCPGCKQGTRFRKKVYTVFVHSDENPNEPGVVYQNDVEYECVRCGRIVKKETLNG